MSAKTDTGLPNELPDQGGRGRKATTEATEEGGGYLDPLPAPPSPPGIVGVPSPALLTSLEEPSNVPRKYWKILESSSSERI